MSREYNFDGLVGPTHHYAGLSKGNRASIKHKAQVSYPKKAALEGLTKMKLLMDRGYNQALLPPHSRPAWGCLKQLGFSGSPEQILKAAWDFSPSLLSACYSASNMWTANSATVSPSADTKDRKVHFTPANLNSHLHRSLEVEQTHKVLKKIFSDTQHFVVHSPLPSVSTFSDEGGANHSRLCAEYSQAGVELFAYGLSAFQHTAEKVGDMENMENKKFIPRQSKEAAQAISFRHGLSKNSVVIAQQKPEAVDAGVFHNDVICTADGNLIFYHEQSFLDTEATIKEIEEKLQPTPLLKIKVTETEIPLSLGVSSYLFNSQLLPLVQDSGLEGLELEATKDLELEVAKGLELEVAKDLAVQGLEAAKKKWLLVAPSECEKDPLVKSYLESLKGEWIKEVQFVSLGQSMRNGGGPACLRLRVVLTDEEAKAIHQGVILTDAMYQQLVSWVEKHYRDELIFNDLLDPSLIQESQSALDELTTILHLESIYDFQG